MKKSVDVYADKVLSHFVPTLSEEEQKERPSVKTAEQETIPEENPFGEEQEGVLEPQEATEEVPAQVGEVSLPGGAGQAERTKRRSASSEKRKRKTGGRVSGRKRSNEIEPVGDGLEERGLVKNPRLTITIPERTLILLKAYRMRHRKRYIKLIQQIKEDLIITMEQACKEDPALQEMYEQLIKLNKLSEGGE